LGASSGDQIRHRLSRAGNRRLNHVLHIAAIVQIRHETEGRAYYRRKLAESKTPMEALRCLKRRISDAVYRQLVADANAAADSAEEEAGPGGHSGATPQSSAADLHTPVIGSSDKPQPGPARSTLPRTGHRSNTHAGLDSQPTTSTRQSRQGGAPYGTNDLDGDKRRRTLKGAETAPLTQRGSYLGSNRFIRRWWGTRGERPSAWHSPKASGRAIGLCALRHRSKWPIEWKSGGTSWPHWFHTG
jgi:hypothetical protein